MGCSLSSTCGHIVPTRSEVPVFANVQDIEGTVLARIQAALEDLPVPNKFADVSSCNHKIPEDGSFDHLTFSFQGRFTHGYEGFHVEHDNGCM